MENFIMITINPFDYAQTITVHNGEENLPMHASMDDTFQIACGVAKKYNINKIKIATTSFPKEYSMELANNARITAFNLFGENNLEFEVI